MNNNIIIGTRYTQLVGVNSDDPRTYEGEQTAFGGGGRGREKMDIRSGHRESAVLRLGGTTHKQQCMAIGMRCRNDCRHFEYSPPMVGVCAAHSFVY